VVETKSALCSYVNAKARTKCIRTSVSKSLLDISHSSFKSAARLQTLSSRIYSVAPSWPVSTTRKRPDGDSLIDPRLSYTGEQLSNWMKMAHAIILHLENHMLLGVRSCVPRYHSTKCTVRHNQVAVRVKCKRYLYAYLVHLKQYPRDVPH